MRYQTKWITGATLAGLLTIALAGCGPKPTPIPAPPPPTPQVMPGPPVVMPGPPAAVPPTAVPVASTDTPSPVAPPAPVAVNENPAPALPTTVPDPPATPGEVVKADVGVAKAGRSLDQYEGPIVQSAKTFFAVREKVMFQIAIPDAFNKYKATEPVPLTFEEFKQKVLDPNNLKLPTLPPGHTYEWNPEDEELKVRRPKK